jgi:hypothetical protein
MQLGEEEPYPQWLLELQQIALGMFLVWDTLGDDYTMKALVEEAMLSDWARKHRIEREAAIKCLIMVKERFMEEPWAHYIHCRDFKTEGWYNQLIFQPNGNADVLDGIKNIAAGRPFKSNPK